MIADLFSALLLRCDLLCTAAQAECLVLVLNFMNSRAGGIKRMAD